MIDKIVVEQNKMDPYFPHKQTWRVVRRSVCNGKVLGGQPKEIIAPNVSALRPALKIANNRRKLER